MGLMTLSSLGLCSVCQGRATQVVRSRGAWKGAWRAHEALEVAGRGLCEGAVYSLYAARTEEENTFMPCAPGLGKQLRNFALK